MSTLKNRLTLFIVIPFFLCGCRVGNNKGILNENDADKFISSYLHALRSGNVAEIKKYWSEKSLSRHGFEVMHLWVGLVIHITEWKDFLASTGYTYQIENISRKDEYYIIHGYWTKPGTNSAADESHPMPFYLIWENNSWLLGNPIDVLTKNWHRHETDNMLLYYPEDIAIDDHLQEFKLLDEQYQSMCRAMGFSPDRKIEYFKASSPEECGRLLTQPPFNGLAAVTYQDSILWFQIAASTTFYNPHEVMHVVALSSDVPASNPFFSEGLAVAYGGTTFQTAEFAHNYAKNLLDRGNYISIKQLLTMNNADFLRLNYITYQESGSFIRYLVNSYGIDKLKVFLSDFALREDLDAQALKAFHGSLDELEEQWERYLSKIELPSIGFSIPENAKSDRTCVT